MQHCASGREQALVCHYSSTRPYSFGMWLPEEDGAMLGSVQSSALGGCATCFEVRVLLYVPGITALGGRKSFKSKRKEALIT